MDPMLTWMQVAALAVAGMCHALLGSTKVPLARKLEIDEARVGGLVSVFGFTLIPMVLAAGFLVDALGKQAVLAGGFVLLIASLVLLARLRTYAAALAAVLLLGCGWSALVNVLNVTSPPAFLPAADIPRRMAYAMNMGDFVFGMGAFLTPIVVALLIRLVRLERTFLILSSLAVVPLLLGLGVHWERLAPPATESVAGGLGILLVEPIVWLCCLAFFCHVPIEASVATWATTLMTDRGVSEARASTLLSVFWLTFMGSRLVTALTLPQGADTLLVTVMAALCIAFTLGIVFSRRGWLTCAMVVAAGMILGPIFPTLIAILLSHVQSSLHGRTVGLFFCIGGIGWTAIPLLIGAYAKRTGVQRAFLIATLSAALLTGLCAALAGYLHERSPVPPPDATAIAEISPVLSPARILDAYGPSASSAARPAGVTTRSAIDSFSSTSTTMSLPCGSRRV
jgi:fucose permease